jgi:uncharacterized membrane protein (DUF106 family)
MNPIKLFLKAFRKYLDEQRRHNTAFLKDLEREKIAMMKSQGKMIDFIDALLKELNWNDDEKPTS